MSWLNCRFSCCLLTVYLSMLRASDLIQPDEGQMNLSGADLHARCDHAGGHIANLIHGCRAGGEESSLSIVWSACRVSLRRVRAQQTTLTLCLGEVTRRPKVKRKMGHILRLRGRRQATRNIKTPSCGRETPARGCAYWILDDQANRMIHRFRRTLWNPARPFGASKQANRLEVSWAAIKSNDRPVKNLVGAAGCCEDFGEGGLINVWIREDFIPKPQVVIAVERNQE